MQLVSKTTVEPTAPTTETITLDVGGMKCAGCVKVVEKQLTQHPDVISATFHRSLDGTRTMNYGQWRSLANFEELVKNPKYASLNLYWRGLAENEFHLYEVVFTASGAATESLSAG